MKKFKVYTYITMEDDATDSDAIYASLETGSDWFAELIE